MVGGSNDTEVIDARTRFKGEMDEKTEQIHTARRMQSSSDPTERTSTSEPPNHHVWSRGRVEIFAASRISPDAGSDGPRELWTRAPRVRVSAAWTLSAQRVRQQRDCAREKFLAECRMYAEVECRLQRQISGAGSLSLVRRSGENKIPAEQSPRRNTWRNS